MCVVFRVENEEGDVWGRQIIEPLLRQLLERLVQVTLYEIQNAFLAEVVAGQTDSSVSQTYYLVRGIALKERGNDSALEVAQFLFKLLSRFSQNFEDGRNIVLLLKFQ